MTDRRLSPDRGWMMTEDPGSIAVPVADLLAKPDGPRDRQLVFGETVSILGIRDGIAHVRAKKDGYHGFVAAEALGPDITPTHRVCAPATHVYSAPDIKSPDLLSLTFGSRVVTIDETQDFFQSADGYIPKQHLCPVDQHASDPALECLNFLGTPYLWGGNSRWGLDCSGLVQAALLACGLPCPGDSDLQARAFGPALPEGSMRKRNDLLFWKGHVAWVADETTLIHANAFHMAVAFEPLASAIARIADQGDGPVTRHARLTPS